MSAVLHLRAETFLLPTANHALFEKGGEEKFFVGTTGKPWLSGCFGCVRTEGRQMHEGLDIRCLQRDKRGEPIDPVMATADGAVVYINSKPSLSNYGNYILLRHKIDGLEIYSLYAHLSKIRDGLKVSAPVKAGETIATMDARRTPRKHFKRARARPLRTRFARQRPLRELASEKFSRSAKRPRRLERAKPDRY